MTRDAFAWDEAEHAEFRSTVLAQVDEQAGFPAWPFRDKRGYATVFEFDVVIGGDFGGPLDQLARFYGDTDITVLAISPSLETFRIADGRYPSFRIDADLVAEGYGWMMVTPSIGATNAPLIDMADVLAITGSTGKWAVYTQRDWEVAVLVTPDEFGPWLTTGVKVWNRHVDFDLFRGPVGWVMPLTREDREAFYRAMDEWGAGDSPEISERR